VTVNIEEFRIIVLVSNVIEYWSNCSILFELTNIRTALVTLVGDVFVAAAAGDVKSETDAGPKPRALHKTQSIFLRNLAPTITHQEVEAVVAASRF